MSSAPDVSLASFLQKELSDVGLPLPNPGSVPNIPWELSRDKFGFVITTAALATKDLKRWLETAMGGPKFECEGTTIYRRDELSLTIMVTMEDEILQIIVLLWSDPAIREEIDLKRAGAIENILDSEITSINEQIVASLDSGDPLTSERLLREAERRLSEVQQILGGDCDQYNP